MLAQWFIPEKLRLVDSGDTKGRPHFCRARNKESLGTQVIKWFLCTKAFLIKTIAALAATKPLISAGCFCLFYEDPPPLHLFSQKLQFQHPKSFIHAQQQEGGRLPSHKWLQFSCKVRLVNRRWILTKKMHWRASATNNTSFKIINSSLARNIMHTLAKHIKI